MRPSGQFVPSPLSIFSFRSEFITDVLTSLPLLTHIPVVGLLVVLLSSSRARASSFPKTSFFLEKRFQRFQVRFERFGVVQSLDNVHVRVRTQSSVVESVGPEARAYRSPRSREFEQEKYPPSGSCLQRGTLTRNNQTPVFE